MTPEDRITRLEETVAFLERHVTDQDKVLLDLTGELGRLRKTVATLNERLNQAPPSHPAAPSHERPPHYGSGQ